MQEARPLLLACIHLLFCCVVNKNSKKKEAQAREREEGHLLFQDMLSACRRSSRSVTGRRLTSLIEYRQDKCTLQGIIMPNACYSALARIKKRKKKRKTPVSNEEAKEKKEARKGKVITSIIQCAKYEQDFGMTRTISANFWSA